MPAADRVSPPRGRRSAARVVERHHGARDVMPAAAMRASQYTVAPASSAARPRSSAASSSTSESPNDRSAEAWITRSATARESGGRCERSIRERRIR